MTRKRRRLVILGGGMTALAAATALVLWAISGNIVFFYDPSQLAAKGVGPGRLVRIGGMVEQHSVTHLDDGREVEFRVTDGKKDLPVVYDGILPDLFREGQGVVAEGELNGRGVFVASTVLAKHDAKYMPPDVAAALKKEGRWQEGGKPPP